MTPSAEHERATKIDAAFDANAAPRRPSKIRPRAQRPDAAGDRTIPRCAIYHSPIAFVRTRSRSRQPEAGRSHRVSAADGAPAQPIAARTPARPDVIDIMKRLCCSARSNQRGINDLRRCIWPSANGCRLSGFCSRQAPDPELRTRIDDHETAREMAVNAGLIEIAEVLGAGGKKRP
jgi:hypothetical protein